METLIAHYSETGNTAQVALAICSETLSQGREVHLTGVSGITPGTLNAYDLILLGSTCHDADLARRVRGLLEQLPMRFLS